MRAQVNKDKLEQEEQDRIQEVEKEAEKYVSFEYDFTMKKFLVNS